MAPKIVIETTKDEKHYLEQMSGSVIKENIICADCEDRGYVLNSEDQAILCQCTKTKLWHERFEEAGIATIFYDKTINANWNVKQDAFGKDLGPLAKDKQAVGSFMEKYNRGIPQLCRGEKIKLVIPNKSNRHINSLILAGGIQSGKSLIASISAQEAIKKYGLTAKVYDWTYICSKLSSYEFTQEQDLIAQDFKERDFIVIDGVQNYKINHPCFIFQLDRISNERLKSAKPTIITVDGQIDWAKMNTGQHWKSLIASCYNVKLPSIICEG